MSANRLTAQFAQQPVAHPSAALVACASPAGMMVMVAVPVAQAALQQQVYQLAWERARRTLEPPRHYRLLANMN